MRQYDEVMEWVGFFQLWPNFYFFLLSLSLKYFAHVGSDLNFCLLHLFYLWRREIVAAGSEFYVQFHFWTLDKFLMLTMKNFFLRYFYSSFVHYRVSFVISCCLAPIHLKVSLLHVIIITEVEKGRKLFIVCCTKWKMWCCGMAIFIKKKYLICLRDTLVTLTSKVFSIILTFSWYIHKVKMERTYLFLRWYFNSSRLFSCLLACLPVAVLTLSRTSHSFYDFKEEKKWSIYTNALALSLSLFAISWRRDENFY
jgi:hypothetical protein